MNRELKLTARFKCDGCGKELTEEMNGTDIRTSTDHVDTWAYFSYSCDCGHSHIKYVSKSTEVPVRCDKCNGVYPQERGTYEQFCPLCGHDHWETN